MYIRAFTERSTQDNNTLPKTLWSETLVDILLDGLEREKPDAEIKKTIRMLYMRDCKPSYIVNKVKKELGEPYTSRLYSLLAK